jgi:hypothetical protein
MSPGGMLDFLHRGEANNDSTKKTAINTFPLYASTKEPERRESKKRWTLIGATNSEGAEVVLGESEVYDRLLGEGKLVPRDEEDNDATGGDDVSSNIPEEDSFYIAEGTLSFD